jgi:hypothetical protein
VNYSVVFLTLIIIILLVILFLLLKHVMHGLIKSMFLHKLHRVVVMPGFIVLVFSVLVIIVYKMR